MMRLENVMDGIFFFRHFVKLSINAIKYAKNRFLIRQSEIEKADVFSVKKKNILFFHAENTMNLL